MSNSIISLLLLPLIVQLSSADIEFPTEATTTNRGTFSSTLFSQISQQNENENIIVSPFSIQAALTLLYLGAGGKTAEELRNGLQYTSPNKLENAEYISKILNSKTNGLVQLKIANRIYTNYEVASNFRNTASKLKSDAVQVNFADSRRVIRKINTWVEDRTNNKITNLLGPNAIDENTSVMLINVIYFKAKWEDQFSNYSTKPQPFWLSPSKSTNVDTMSADITAKYGEFPELDATAIELKYEDKNMAMLVILPNQRDGLKALEQKLVSVDLTRLSADMNEDEIQVKLPKFKVEFDIDLVPVLSKMGMEGPLSYGANYSEIFKTSVPVQVTDVVHKAFIEVNEYGSEAAAATYIKAVFLSSSYNPNPKIFVADHPFVFAIKNDEAVYFVGHIKKF